MNEILEILDRFISDTDTSIEAANRLEVLLEDRFPDDQVVADMVVDLAMYRPNGGEMLFDQKAIKVRLTRLRDYLDSSL